MSASVISFSWKTSAGVRQPRHFRGVALSSWQMAMICHVVRIFGLTSHGSQRRTRPLLFPTVPFCYGNCASQN